MTVSAVLLLIAYFSANIILSTSIDLVCEDEDDCVIPNVTNGMDKDRLSLFGNWLDDKIENNRIVGASYAVYRKNSLIYESYHGYHDTNKTRKISKDTVFRIFSMTKPVISVGLMMLWEQNKFELTDPLSKYIPSFANMTLYDYANNQLQDINISNISLENINTKPVQNDIQIWHIMTHTAGLSYGFDATGQLNPVDKLYQSVVAKVYGEDGGITLEEFIDGLATMPLVFEPGTAWHYSYAADVCGRLIEVISGQTLDRYLDEKIFKPLNMKNTGFKFDDINTDNLASVYQQTDEGVTQYTEFWISAQYEKEYKCFSGGAGLLSTLDDYLSFTKMLVNGGINKANNKRLLSSETIRFMTINHLPQNKDVKSMVYQNSTIKDFWRSGAGFGLGFMVNLNRRVSDGAGTMAPEGVFNFGGALDTLFFVDPTKDLGVVFMVQIVPQIMESYHTPALYRFIYSSIVD